MYRYTKQIKLENKESKLELYDILFIRGSRFLIFNFLQFAIDWKKNSKTKVEKMFFVIFNVFLCGNEIFKQKNH
jgi:hypothetical protein